MSTVYRAHDHNWKHASGHDVSREALTNALLETVRIVLEEQGSELQRLAPDSPVVRDHAYDSLSDRTSSDSYVPAPVPKKKPSAPKGSIPGGPCSHCGAQESPQWRRPLTKKVVLCNACGIYYSRHHSLPKRKKNAFGKPAAAAAAPAPRLQPPEQYPDRKADDSSATAPKLHSAESLDLGVKLGGDPMACDIIPPSLKPIRTAPRDPVADGDPRHELIRAASSGAGADTLSAVSLPVVSPATSCGSPMVSCIGGGVTAPPSTPKRRGEESDGYSGYGEVHAEDSLAKRVMKRAATNAAAANAAATASGGASPTGASSRRQVTTAPPGSPGVALMEAMLQRSRISGSGDAPSHGPGTDSHAAGAQSAPLLLVGELSADSDADMVAAAAAAAAQPGFAAGGAGNASRLLRSSSPAAKRGSCPGSPSSSRMKVTSRNGSPAVSQASMQLLRQHLEMQQM